MRGLIGMYVDVNAHHGKENSVLIVACLSYEA